MVESIKDWIKTSKTYTGILAHRQTCSKHRRGKFCIACIGGDVDGVISSLIHENRVEWDKGHTELKIDVFMMLHRLIASRAIPKSMRASEDQDMIDFIQDLTHKDQSEEYEFEGAI